MVNAISIAPFDRKDYIFRTERYNRYKVVNYKRYFKRQAGTPRGGHTIFAYDLGDTLTIVSMGYSPFTNTSGDVTFHRNNDFAIRLKVKDGHLVIWHSTGGNGFSRKIRNFSGRVFTLGKALFRFGNKNTYDGPFPATPPPVVEEDDDDFIPNVIKADKRFANWPNKIKSETREIKVASERLNKILIHFLKRNSIKFKYSKDFFENLRMACYPSSAPFKLDEQWLNPAYSRHFLHGDINYVIQQCFGTDDAKLRDMVLDRIKQDKSFDVLLIGCLLNKYVPQDYFYKALGASLDKLKESHKGYTFKISDCRRLFRRYSPDILLRLVLAQDFKECAFTNAIHALNQIECKELKLPADPQNWAGFYLDLMTVHRWDMRPRVP